MKQIDDLHFVTLQKSKSEEIRFCLSEYKGKLRADIRVWTTWGSADGAMIPTKKGISIDLTQLDEFMNAVDTLKKEAQLRGNPTQSGSLTLHSALQQLGEKDAD